MRIVLILYFTFKCIYADPLLIYPDNERCNCDSLHVRIIENDNSIEYIAFVAGKKNGEARIYDKKNNLKYVLQWIEGYPFGARWEYDNDTIETESQKITVGLGKVSGLIKSQMGSGLPIWGKINGKDSVIGHTLVDGFTEIANRIDYKRYGACRYRINHGFNKFYTVVLDSGKRLKENLDTLFYPNGEWCLADSLVLDTIYTGITYTPYINGLINGELRRYNNGILESTLSFFNGLLFGLQSYYNANGSLSSEKYIDNGKKNGLEKKYTDRGVLLSIECFKNDTLHGVSKFFNDTTVNIKLFINGKLIKETVSQRAR